MRGKNKRRGQVLVMVTLALVAMCGIMGLAVDVGWAYYVEKAAQAAADAAAIAAVSKAYDAVGGAAAEDDAYLLQDTAATPVRCSAVGGGGAFAEGCMYAQRNGFTDNPDGRQAVYMSAGAYSPPPPPVSKLGTLDYWARAVAAERIPQLFSAVLGNRMGGASSRATAAVIWVVSPGSIYGLDRQFDYGVPGTNKQGLTGTDLFFSGGGLARAGGDIYLSSASSGTSPISGRWAADGASSGWEVWSETGNTYIRDIGWTTRPENFFTGVPKIQENPINGQPDGEMFYDPLAGKGQPPPPTNLANCPILEEKVGGETFGYVKATTSTLWGPGNYYSVDAKGQATGRRLLLDPGIKFAAGGFCQNGSETPAGFGGYVFFGGVKLPSGTVNFEPGRYVLAGVREETNKNPGLLLDGRTQTYLTDNTPLVMGPEGDLISPENKDAGEIFIFTDTNYKGGPNSEIPLQIPPDVQPIAGELRFGIVDLHAGSANTQTELNLHGLNAALIPDTVLDKAKLAKFEPVVFWQDQRNSTIPYTPDGFYYCGQTSGIYCAEGQNIDEIPWTSITNGSPEMNLQATPSTHLWGVIYQPRGAWMMLHGGSDQVTSPLTMISGAFQVQGGPRVRLQPTARKLRRQIVALVE